MTEIFSSKKHSKRRVRVNRESDTEKVPKKNKEKPIQHRHVDEYSQTLAAEASCERVFTAYAPKPKHTKFESQAATEHIVLLLRKHLITQVPVVLTVLLFATLPFFFSFFPLYSQMPASFQLGLVAFWYLAVAGYSFKSFLKWFFHVFILTDERVVDVDFLSLIQKNVTTAKIDNIEDVTAESVGFTASFFNYGNVTIQTAGAKQEIIFESVPNPAKVTAVLNDLILEEELEKIQGRVS